MTRHILCVLWALLAFTASSYGCTKYSLMYRLRKCQKELLAPIQLAPIPGGGDRQLLQKLCRKRAYEPAISCIKNVSNSCPAKVRKFVDLFVNVKSLYTAWATLCERRHVYYRYAPCYTSLRTPLLYTCLLTQTQEIGSSVTPGMSQYQVSRIICKATRKGARCQDALINGKCGPVAAKITRDFNRQVLPPACNRTGRRKRSAQLLMESDVNAVMAAAQVPHKMA